MKDNQPEWFELENEEQIDSPALLFYPERIKANIGQLITSIDRIDRLRPHVKTHKSAEVVELMLIAGITKFKCATIAEAEMLGQCGVADVLLAYQPIGPKLRRYLSLISTYPATKFSCLFDNPLSLEELSIAAIASQPISLYLDVNLGMNRTGVNPATAFSLYQAAANKPFINLIGLHAYDGNIHEPELVKREEVWSTGWQTLKNLSNQIISSGLPVPVIVAGGTPTYPFYAALAEVECSPGTFALWDKGYQDSFQEQKYLIAALLLTRVISQPDQRHVTLDLGHKAVAAENELHKRVYFINAPAATIVSQSEEHLVVDLGPDHGFQIGDVLYALPKHICPTVALYERAFIVEQHKTNESWKITSRDRKINI